MVAFELTSVRSAAKVAERLVEVAFEMTVLPKVVWPVTLRLVEVALTTVILVPFAVVKVRPASEVRPETLKLVVEAFVKVVFPKVV